MLIATNGRGHVVKRATKPAIGTMLANLRQGNAHMVVERVDGERPGDWYIQVLLRENNTYQLEYRDGMAEQHFQTMTVSQEKVLTALLGWAAAKPGWQDAFMWNNIGEQFSSSDHGANRAVVPLRDKCVVVGARGSTKAASASG
ncbi:hypothetical protein [Streptomyces sp. NRRL F-4474]|uniref:hypothetical protein n=1 Tax=Streptomyces sp. NRRL F-4474 TaxID=1463851 RepID=UPI0007C74BFE|nr:hypothetical protein [Streptomyces sp. NRRL F-4474]